MENESLPGKPIQRVHLHQQAKDAPLSPGVYLMKDSDKGILYVGKAKSLKNRLVTYFQGYPHENPRIDLLVSRISEFELILTESESEALILEATLIKKYRPKFNIRLKDDKAYPYLKIQVEAPFPRIEWTRRVLKDGARYFGPFPSAWAARQVLELLNLEFKLRDCSDNAFRHRSRPCILFQMGQCVAPCVGKVTQEEYQDTIGQVVAVMEGRSTRLIDDLRAQMQKAAENEAYEEAAYFRDQLQYLEVVTATQSVVEAGAFTHRDVIAIARHENAVQGVVLLVRAGKLIAVKQVVVQNADVTQTDAEILSEFISQFYLANPATEDLHGEEPELQVGRAVTSESGATLRAKAHSGSVPPHEIVVPCLPEHSDILERVLGTHFRVPSEGSDLRVDGGPGDRLGQAALPEPAGQSGGERLIRQLLNVARTNAEHAAQGRAKSAKGHSLKDLEEIQQKLHLERVPLRIECYDISNLQGEDAVASRVVFVDGAPEKTLYRRYKIKTVVGANDFAMMKEVLGRRFSNQEEGRADLVVVDGGKGQLAQAVAILRELGVEDVAVVGLAKARTESDFQATEVDATLERIFIPGRKNPVPLLPHMGAYRVLTHIRDEAHRFAVSYHRVLRRKRHLGEE